MPPLEPTKTHPLPQADLTDGGSLSTETSRQATSEIFVSESGSLPKASAGEVQSLSTQTRYEVRKRLGSGSFGTVDLAWDHQLQREVAIKRPRAALSDSVKRSFLREAQLVARLRHPSVVVVHDVQVDETGNPFIVYEYLAGQTLREKLKPNEPLPLSEAISIAIAIAEGLAVAQKLGLTHRDLKPANILLDAEGRPRIVDFGLAIEEDQQRERKGEVAGTGKYMAPEQVRGEAHQLDGRTDLWALGVILYEMLTGRHPFPGTNPEDVKDQILNRDPRPPRQWVPEISKPAEELVLKLLTKPLAQRFASAHEVVESLRLLRERVTDSAASQPAKKLTRYRFTLATAAILMAGAFAGTGLYYYSSTTDQAARAVFTDEDFEQGAWTKLMQQSPPGAVSIDATTALFHQPSKLSVSSQYQEYLLLGRTVAKNFSFKLRLVPTQWQGNSGIFLGYVDTPDRGEMTALLISLVKDRDGKCVIERQIAVQQPAGFQTVTNMTQLLRSTNAVPVGHEVNLQVDVDGGQVARIFVDGKQMRFPDQPFPGKAAAGMFGIYNQSGACTYLDPEFLRR